MGIPLTRMLERVNIESKAGHVEIDVIHVSWCWVLVRFVSDLYPRAAKQ